jgi:2-polyprenyl-3-methyl-5-hydroxy-6-metoxy-1,4-benzoquinol methylase
MTSSHTVQILDDKRNPYYGIIRRELIDEVPVGVHEVLEIGCGEGSTGAVLKAEGRALWVTGIELDEGAASKAAKVLDQVISGNIEHIDLPFADGQFDAILLGDVLEHLVDPWAQVRRLASYLAPHGLLVASIPNVRNWRVIAPLLFLGKWEYQDFGLLDRTHLRFFTRRGIINLFEENGFTVVKLLPGKAEQDHFTFIIRICARFRRPAISCGMQTKRGTTAWPVIFQRSISSSSIGTAGRIPLSASKVFFAVIMLTTK